jgi:surface protein
MKIKFLIPVLLLGQLTSVYAEPTNVLRLSSSPLQSLNNSGQSNDNVPHPSCTAEQPVVTYDELKGMIGANKDVTNVCTSQITDMSNLFYRNETFNQDISNWDVSNVTKMENMFYSAYAFNQDISNWNVSSVVNMNRMFYQTKAFNQEIGKWDVSKVEIMGSMFTLNESFSADISMWNVSMVTDMNRMFYLTKSFNSDLSNWDVSNVIDSSYFSLDSSLSAMYLPNFSN